MTDMNNETPEQFINWVKNSDVLPKHGLNVSAVCEYREFILNLLQNNNESLKNIYTYLCEQKIIDCSYSSFQCIFKTYVCNSKIRDLRKSNFSNVQSTNKHTQASNYVKKVAVSAESKKIKEGALGLPENSFDNWNGDSRDFIKELL